VGQKSKPDYFCDTFSRLLPVNFHENWLAAVADKVSLLQKEVGNYFLAHPVIRSMHFIR